MSKILYLFDQTDWKSRMPVAIEARDEGYDVVIALIGDGKAPDDLPSDFDFHYVVTPKGKFRGFSLLKMSGQIRKLIGEHKPDLVHTVTLKYGFVTGLAALPFKALNKVFTLAGLGYLFRGENKKAELIRTLLSPLLKIALKAPNTKLIFQNPDDLELMVGMGFAKLDDSILIRGSGVHLDEFVAKPEPESDEPIVLMPTRLVYEKGIHIFVEAARILKDKGVQARFQIAGGETQHNPRAIPRTEMLELTKDQKTEWLGRVDDMPALLNQSALIVYPSYYGEGIPRVLLESCAAGRPVITTDHAGCREAVDHEQNGLLVPIKDVEATAAAIEQLISDPEKRKEMGQKSREKAQAEFDIHIVVHKTLSVYKDVLS